jgi:hypothetical protein
MHLPIETYRALVEMITTLTSRVRPVVADPEALDLLDAVIGAAVRLAVEHGHPGVLPAADPGTSRTRTYELRRATTSGATQILAAIDRELPELETREAAAAEL